MAAEEKAESGQAAPAAGGTNKLVVISSLVNMLATGGMVAVLFMSYSKEKAKPTVEDIVAGQAEKKSGHGEGHGEGEKKEGVHGEGHGEVKEGGEGKAELNDVGKIVPLETFTVNLSSSAGTNPRYIRMNVAVELEQGGQDKEFELKMPRVRDTIINLLNSKKAQEINAPDGRLQLKEEIKKTVNSFLIQVKVKDIYFTNFAINN